MTTNEATLLQDTAHAAGWDSGNRSMRAGGRSTWNIEDWNAAAAETNRLLDSLEQHD